MSFPVRAFWVFSCYTIFGIDFFFIFCHQIVILLVIASLKQGILSFFVFNEGSRKFLSKSNRHPVSNLFCCGKYCGQPLPPYIKPKIWWRLRESFGCMLLSNMTIVANLTVNILLYIAVDICMLWTADDGSDSLIFQSQEDTFVLDIIVT